MDYCNNFVCCSIIPDPEHKDHSVAFSELTVKYIHEDQNVPMHAPLPCSYVKERETVILGTKVRTKKTRNRELYTPLDVEMRGITLRQLRGVYANVVRRCIVEEWYDDHSKQPVTPDTINLYHINKYIIKPFTERSRKSFVETLPSTRGTQPPRFFISHWWGESFRHTLDCLETMLHDFRSNFDSTDDARGGGMTEDTPVWICAFANNQWALGEEMTVDPKDSSFKKAMEVACFRTISILDSEGIVFSRLWCMYELYATLILRKNESVSGLWAVYTSHQHKFTWDGDGDVYSRVDRDCVAVGIIQGGAPCDIYSKRTRARESFFPLERILKSQNIAVETATASKLEDKRHILNSIAKSDNIDADPPTAHGNYVALNNALKGSFAASPGALQAIREGGSQEEWENIVYLLSKGAVTHTFVVNLKRFNPCLSSSEARALISHVPVTCNGLNVWSPNNGEGAINGVIDWLGKAKPVKTLKCSYCHVDNSAKARLAGERLAAVLASKHAKSIEYLSLLRTNLFDEKNVSYWAAALKKMTNLKDLMFTGTSLSEKFIKILCNAACHVDRVVIVENIYWPPDEP